MLNILFASELSTRTLLIVSTFSYFLFRFNRVSTDIPSEWIFTAVAFLPVVMHLLKLASRRHNRNKLVGFPRLDGSSVDIPLVFNAADNARNFVPSRMIEIGGRYDSIGDPDLLTTFQIARDGMALQYASKERRNDEELVLFALARNGLALQFASRALRDNQKVVLAAVARNPDALRYASPTMQAGGLTSYVREILAFRQFVFGRCDKEYPSDIMRNIQEYMGIQLSEKIVHDARKIDSALVLHVSADMSYLSQHGSVFEIS